MVIHGGIEVLLTEDIDQPGKVVRDMAVAEDLSDHSPVLVLRQDMGLGLSLVQFGGLNEKFFERI